MLALSTPGQFKCRAGALEYSGDQGARCARLQLLAHQAGVFAFNEPVDRSVGADLDRLAVVLAR